MYRHIGLLRAPGSLNVLSHRVSRGSWEPMRGSPRARRGCWEALSALEGGTGATSEFAAEPAGCRETRNTNDYGRNRHRGVKLKVALAREGDFTMADRPNDDGDPRPRPPQAASDFPAQRTSLSPHTWQLIEELRTDPRGLLGDQFVEDLRDSVKRNLASRKRWWESSLLVALIPTLGGVVCTTIWQAYSRHTDQLLAQEQRAYDRRVSLRAAFDVAMQRQASALETICVRSTVGSFQQLKRKWILEEEKGYFQDKLKRDAKKQRLASLLAALDSDLTQSASVEKEEVSALAKAYEVSVSERRLDSYVGELKAVFTTQATQKAADRFAGSWAEFEAETRPQRVEEWRAKLRASARQSRQDTLAAVKSEARLSLDECALAAVQRARKLACTEKADAVRAAYADLSSSAASELQTKQP